MSDFQIESAIYAAIKCLRAEAPPLAFNKVHERSTAHRLAVHLEPHFRDWNVDCEYNLSENVLKVLRRIKECDEQRKTDRILPDIIVHKRGVSGTAVNLLVIEIKKATAEDPCDRRKLELMTCAKADYHYQHGLYLNIEDWKLTWYRNGSRVSPD